MTDIYFILRSIATLFLFIFVTRMAIAIYHEDYLRAVADAFLAGFGIGILIVVGRLQARVPR